MKANGIGATLQRIENTISGFRKSCTDGVRSLVNGPLVGILSRIVIVLVGLSILLKAFFRILNSGAYRIEKILVVIATLAMTALVFNVYLIEQSLTIGTDNAEQPVEQTTESTNAPPLKAPTTTAPTSTPPVPTVSTGPTEVIVSGEATEVQLSNDGGTFPVPGQVERGTYQVVAKFPGWDAPGEAGEVTLEGTGPITLKCDPFAETCRVKKKPKRPSFLPPVAEPETQTNNSGMLAVQVDGSATNVSLNKDGQSFNIPGDVAAGTYAVKAQFDGWDAPGEAGEVTLEGTGPITLKCDPFAETCRVKKKRKLPPFMANKTPATASATADTESASPIQVSVKGGGRAHRLEGTGGPYALPGMVPPGKYVVKAEFDKVGEITAGSVHITEDHEEFGLHCDDSTWQCVEDGEWWNVWSGEGQLNLALMLMVAMGFLGASIATVQGKHLAVDATDRILSPGPARLVKRLTSLIAAGLCFILMSASWEKIIDTDSVGSTFAGAKVWWWMVKPINFVTQWLPGDKYGPGTEYFARSNWEDAMIEQGQEWPFGLAYSYVQQGDGFPLWIPLLFLVFAFGIMGLRFFGQFLVPPLPKRASKPGTRKPMDVVVAGAFPGALIALGLSIWLGQGFMIVIAALLLVFMGSPLFIAVGVATLAGWILLQDSSATTIVSDMFEATKKQEIIAIPFFVLAGNIMTHGSIAQRLIAFAQALVGPLPGGLGVAAVLACAVFAAISGSSPATVIAIGSIMFPMLIKKGYSENFSLGLLSTSGSLGIIIPPSVPLIIYAVMVSNPTGPVGILSPTELFKGGVVPGLFIASALVFYTLYVNWPRPAAMASTAGTLPMNLPWLIAPTEEANAQNNQYSQEEPNQNYIRNLWMSFIRGIPSLFLPVLVLGGLYGWFVNFYIPGIGAFPIAFDVTQAAAIAVVYALFVELFIHRELKPSDVPGVCIETASMIGSLFLILVIAISLNKLLVFLDVPQYATETMLQYTDSPLTFLIAVNIFLLLLGCVMDIISAILIVAPLLAPIAAQYGIHPIHFGIMFIVNLELGYLTPPMGINLFVASTTFERSLVQVIKSIVPFLLVMLFCLLCVIWLPRWFQAQTCYEVPGLPAFTEAYLEENNLCQADSSILQNNE